MKVRVYQARDHTGAVFRKQRGETEDGPIGNKVMAPRNYFHRRGEGRQKIRKNFEGGGNLRKAL